MDRNPALCRMFVAETRVILGQYPAVHHSWSIDDEEDHCMLSFPADSEDGFDIVVEVYPARINVFAGGWQGQFAPFETLDSLIDHVLGLIRDLLSPHMRIREKWAGTQPYHWFVESFHDGTWTKEYEFGYRLWNYFGRKSERVLQNRVLEGRLDKPNVASR